MKTSADSNQNTLRQEAYAFSLARIAEQVAINALSAFVIAVGAGAISAFLLVLQQLAHFVVVPSNILVIIALFGAGAFVMLLLVMVVLYVFVRRLPPMALAFGALGFLSGLAFESGAFAEALRKTTGGAKAGKEASRSGTATPGAAPSDLDSAADRLEQIKRSTRPQY